MAEKLARHEMMSGNALTWGPNEKDEYLAGGTCKECRAQLVGKYSKSTAKLSEDLSEDDKAAQRAHLSRQHAAISLYQAFDEHVCDPKAMNEGKAPAGIPWKGS